MKDNYLLKKEIGLFTLIAVGVGSMVGSGIFALPAAMSAVSGPGLILAILLTGIVATIIAIPYAELGAAFPMTGGPYSFPRLAMGDFCGFLIGWGYYLYMFIGTAAIIDIFVVYLAFYFPSLAVGQALTPLGTSISIIALWLFSFINMFGVKWGGMYSLVTTILKVILLLAFGFIGIFLINTGNFIPFLPYGLTGVTLAMTLFFWSFTGFETLVVPSEEIKNPAKNIPIAMVLTMIITTAIYLFVAIAFVGLIDWGNLGLASHDWKAIGQFGSPLSEISLGNSLPWLAILAMIGAMIATGGSGGNWVLIQSRLPFAMAQDNLFPSYLGKVSRHYGTPIRSIIFSSVLTTIIMIAIPDFPSISLVASLTAIVPYSAAMISLPILRKTHSHVPRPFKMAYARFFTLIGFIIATWLVYWAAWPWTLVGSLLIILGYPLYFFVKKKYDIAKTLWLLTYLVGIVFISFIGDDKFEFNNFLSIRPLGWLMMPYDMIVLTVFSVIIYYWAYFQGINSKLNNSE